MQHVRGKRVLALLHHRLQLLKAARRAPLLGWDARGTLARLTDRACHVRVAGERWGAIDGERPREWVAAVAGPVGAAVPIGAHPLGTLSPRVRVAGLPRQ